MAERSEMFDLSDDEVGTAAVSASGDEARVEYSRLDTKLMGKPQKFAEQDALCLD